MRSDSSYDLIPEKYIKDIQNSLWQPVHYYALRMSPIPIKISDRTFIQLTYSEFYFKILHEAEKINLSSRPAIQQFIRLSDNNISVPKDCFSTPFAFYVSWFPYIEKQVTFSNYDSEDCPFYIPEDISFNFFDLYKQPFSKLQEKHIPFFIKKNYKGVYKKHGKINKYTPAYKITIGETNE